MALNITRKILETLGETFEIALQELLYFLTNSEEELQKAILEGLREFPGRIKEASSDEELFDIFIEVLQRLVQWLFDFLSEEEKERELFETIHATIEILKRKRANEEEEKEEEEEEEELVETLKDTVQMLVDRK